MKITAIIAVVFSFLLFFCAGNSTADNFSFELSANQDALDSEFEAVIETLDSMVMTGISGVYKSDEYKVAFLKALIGNQIFIDGFTGALGFKGAWGEAEKRYIEGDVLNLGFTCFASYDLSKSNLNNFPIILASSFYISPEPLSYGDTEEFLEFTAEANWKILDQAAVVVSYRYIEIDFDKRTKWQKSDSAGYLGLKFLF